MSDSSKSHELQEDCDFDAILDDALEDFSKPLPSVGVPGAPGGQSALPPAAAGIDGMLTEDTIRQATQNFEATMRAIMEQQQKLAQHQSSFGGQAGAPLPADSTAELNVQSLTAEFAKFADAASKVAASTPVTAPAAGSLSTVAAANTATSSSSAAAAAAAAAASAANASLPSTTSTATEAATTATTEQPDFQNILTNVMEQLSKNNEDYKSSPMPDELSNMLAGMGLGAPGAGEQSAGEAGNLFPLMQTMLENILCKDVLYPPIKEIVDKYPDWLADNRANIESSEFDRYSRQFDIMKKVVELFESEKESDSDEIKAKRFEDLIGNMQKLQEEGHPPTDLAGENSGNITDLFGGDNPLLSNTDGVPGAEQCTMM